MAEYLNSNVLGLHRVVLAFLPALRTGTKKQIVIITSAESKKPGPNNTLIGPYVSVVLLMLVEHSLIHASPATGRDQRSQHRLCASA